MEMLRTKCPEMVRKEVAMHLLGYHLIRGIMAEAARTGKLPPSRKGLGVTLEKWLSWGLSDMGLQCQTRKMVILELRALVKGACGLACSRPVADFYSLPSQVLADHLELFESGP